MHLYTVLWVVVATVFCMLSQKRQLPRRYAIAGHEPVEVYPESFGRIEVKPISNWRGWGGTYRGILAPNAPNRSQVVHPPTHTGNRRV